jgi:hypothetical protein
MLTIFVLPYHQEGSEQKQDHRNNAACPKHVDPSIPSLPDREESDKQRLNSDTEKNPPDGQDS